LFDAFERAARAGRLHQIKIYDSFPRRRPTGKPRRKAQGCQFRRSVVTPAGREKQYFYAAADSADVAFYEMTDAGKKVFYLLRRLSRSGAAKPSRRRLTADLRRKAIQNERLFI
jgi:hypothetical protein